MFRLMLSGNVAGKSFGGLSTQFTRSMTNYQINPQTQPNRPRAEKMDVTICGSIFREPIISDKGFVTLAVITNNDDNEHSTYHRVILSKSNLITALGDRLSSGQRIYVNGSLRYFDFIGNDEKKKRTGYILPNQIRICEQNVGDDDQLRALSDVNEVKLFGRVLHKARSTDNCTFLDMITHFFDRSLQQYRSNMHQLTVQDDEKLRSVICGIEEGCRLYVHGRIKTFGQLGNDGKKKTVCFIEPKKLILSRSDIDDEERGDASTDF